MGKHYVPQYLLRGWETAKEEGIIWRYDKGTGALKDLPIKNVAQTANFYPPAIEKRLTLEVENPANPVIDKIRAGKGLLLSERKVMAKYIATMMTRVPKNRERRRKILPGTLDRIVESYKEGAERDIASGKLTAEQAHAILESAARVRAGFDVKLPQVILEKLDDPFPNQVFIDTIYHMHWRMLMTTGPVFFICCDTPMHFFDSIGLGDPEAEVIMPVSPRAVIHCCQQPFTSPFWEMAATQDAVREFNSRLTNDASQYLFYHEDAPFVRELMVAGELPMNRIQW
jgi:Protein of unknown function (DUF4238)